MPSTFFGMNIAVSGMSTYNAVLNTTAHNIANIKTVGYSRQSVIQSARDAVSLKTSYGMMGSGVNAKEILSSRDEYYDYKYRLSNTALGKYDTEAFYLSSIEDYFYPKDEETGSVTNSLDNFFSSLKYLTTSSMNTTIRAEAVGYADTLAYYTRDLGTKLQRLQADVNTEIATTVKQINAYAEEIASLNQQINALEVQGTKANDLRDQRAAILDELSELADIQVMEKVPQDGNGINQFVVTLGGGTLVDSFDYNTIEVVANEDKVNQNDIDNMYSLRWSFGQKFDMYNTNLGGKLQGLIEVRDGNNGENFKAGLTGVTADTLTITSDQFSSDNASSLAKLGIPESDGVITISNVSYAYESFSVSVAADGTYTYEFKLKEPLKTEGIDRLQKIIDSGDRDAATAEVGTSIGFRGIPYYMAQLNEFARTFSASFNQLQNSGYDMNGDLGQDLFLASDKVTGLQYDMTELIKNSKDGFFYLDGCKVFDTNAAADYINKGYTFEDGPAGGGTGYYNLVDKDGNVVERVYKLENNQDPIFEFDSSTKQGDKACYYSMTVLNMKVNDNIVSDGRLLACSKKNTEGVEGWDEAENLEAMIALQSDNSMFKQGDPGSFLTVLTTASLGVDSRRVSTSADNALNILNAVENRRMSKSGVDEDEEGQNMIICQNLLNYQYRVLSVMNEVLDKLINGTAV